MVLFICNDLFFQPQVQQAAKSAQLTLVSRPNLDAATQWLEALEGDTLQALIVDLKTVGDIATLAAFFQLAKTRSNGSLASVAYGPHVKVELLQAATDAGFQQVLTQGQFNRDVRNVLQQMAG